ncbi:MAG: Hsp20/alpha crystallin family protein [Candidatus Hydrogenedentota bacterium]|nr:MAG: Hsp20/alpha crystallin family protein [Candidatus Hydrogenedentota bacterium]
MTKREAETVSQGEVTRSDRAANRAFLPDVDIIEKEKEFHLYVDLPGVAESDLDITLDRNVLNLSGKVTPVIPENARPLWTEYRVADFRRSFNLSDEIDRDRIQAKLVNGVLHLILPKAAAAQIRKIAVESAD